MSSYRVPDVGRDADDPGVVDRRDVCGPADRGRRPSEEQGDEHDEKTSLPHDDRNPSSVTRRRCRTMVCRTPSWERRPACRRPERLRSRCPSMPAMSASWAAPPLGRSRTRASRRAAPSSVRIEAHAPALMPALGSQSQADRGYVYGVVRRAVRVDGIILVP